jgi:hypothetical protein
MQAQTLPILWAHPLVYCVLNSRSHTDEYGYLPALFVSSSFCLEWSGFLLTVLKQLKNGSRTVDLVKYAIHPSVFHAELVISSLLPDDCDGRR